MSTSQTATNRTHPWERALATFFTCLLVGPIIGSIVFWVMRLEGLSSQSLDDHLVAGTAFSLLFLPFAFVAGGVQAAVPGLSLASYGWHVGRPPMWLALLAGTGVSLLFPVLLLDFSNGMIVATLAIHLIASLACWLLVSILWMRLAT